MTTTITNVANPVYSVADNSMIDVKLTTAEFGIIPCSLHPADATIYALNGAAITNREMFTAAAAGQYGAVGAYVAAVMATPVPSCALWQLQSVLTPAQWTAVQAAVAALNNPAVSAFFAHGTNMIPANSTTLLSIGASIGLSAEQVAALVEQAAAVTIP